MNRRELLAGGAQLMAAAAVSSRAGAANPSEAPLLRKIAASGEEVPLIGLGTSRTFEVGASAAERTPLSEVLEGFFASGARLIDTSPMYGSAEAVLGELMTPDMHRRAFLATQVWTPGRRSGAQQMTHSAQLLKSARLDLIQVHNLLDLDTHLKTLRQWQGARRGGFPRVSHHTPPAPPPPGRGLERGKRGVAPRSYPPRTRG